MKVRIFLLFALIGQFLLVSATHNIGGFITYRYISYLTYEATVTTFTKASSTASDRDTITLDWGDGTTENISRGNGPIGGTGVPLGEVIPGGDVKINIYKSATHTYASPCDYFISVSDPNRISNIINFNGGNSVNIPFYIEALIRGETGNSCSNSGAVLLSNPITYANINDTFRFNPTIMDPDGDSLYFELIPPMQSHQYQVPNYQYPDEVPGNNDLFSINHTSGEITWLTPQRTGIYSIAVRAIEFKNGLSYGSTVFDLQIFVEDANVNPPSFNVNWLPDVNGNYSFTVNPGDTVQLGFSAISNTIEALGELFHLSQLPLFSVSGTTPSLSASLVWIPDSSHSRLYPYIATFRATNQLVNPWQKDLTALIYVTGGTRSNCAAPACSTSGISHSSLQSSVSVSPNPFSSSCTIRLNQPVNQDLILKLYDYTGKYLYSLYSSNSEFVINKGTLTNGLHLFQIRNDDSKIISAGRVILGE